MEKFTDCSQRGTRVSQVVLIVKNPSPNAGDTESACLTSGLGRFPRGGHGNPLHYSCLENPMDRGAWWATGLGITKNQI